MLLTEAGFANVNRISSQISATHAIEEEFQSVMVAQLLEIDTDDDNEEDVDPATCNNSSSTTPTTELLSPLPITFDQIKIDESSVERIRKIIAEVKTEQSTPTVLNTHLLQFVKSVVSQTLLMPESEVDVDQCLDSLGMDSLMGLELSNLLQTKLDIKIPIAALIGGEEAELLSQWMEL